MKVGVAFYYKNIEQYPTSWINKCLDSIRNQTYKNFETFELNYGSAGQDIYNFNVGLAHHSRIQPLTNYAEAMNEIYAWIFETCDVAVNVNIDDYYDKRRIDLLLKSLYAGADIASSNYFRIDESGK